VHTHININHACKKERKGVVLKVFVKCTLTILNHTVWGGMFVSMRNECTLAQIVHVPHVFIEVRYVCVCLILPK
jgi:hypothetical protein